MVLSSTGDIGTIGDPSGDLRLLLQELYDQAPMSNTESSHVQHRPELA